MSSETPTTASLAHSLAGWEEFLHNDPAKAAAVGLGVGLAIKILPLRLLVGTTALAALTVGEPLLLSLGVLKAFELYSAKKTSQSKT